MERRNLIHELMLVSLLCLISGVCFAGVEGGDSFDLFAFDNYMMSGKYKQNEVRAETLKELGYAGMSYHGTKGIMETIGIFEKAGLKLFAAQPLSTKFDITDVPIFVNVTFRM